MRDELFDLDIQDVEDIMNGFDKLVHERRALHNDQRKNEVRRLITTSSKVIQ